MTKPDVTADDIRAAMREFDELGRGAFLARYGFGEARRYFLQQDGTDYDSKAIVGAAHTRRHSVPLTAGDFSGGEATVKKILEDLGFEVRVRTAAAGNGKVTETSLGAWVLKCNPEVWDLHGFIAANIGPIKSWTVVPNYRSEMMRYGQRVLLWATGPSTGDTPRGFWGSGWVVGTVGDGIEEYDDPDDSELDDDFWIDLEARDRFRLEIPVDLTPWHEPVAETDLTRVDGLDAIEVIQMRQVSNPSWISADQLALLEPLLPDWPEIGEPAAEPIHVGPGGAFKGDPRANLMVEAAAIEAVSKHYSSAGYDVQSVERLRCGWDLTCTASDGSIARVEVKGVSGTKPSILLTRNEYRSALEDEGWVLAVVTSALRKPMVTLYDADAVREAGEPYVYRADFTNL